ncbi:MAG: glycoside hydrolase family 2 TIM barrel-domain containing protein [Pseudomonadota bacterium]
MAEAIPVSLTRTDSGWQLLRDGEPYFIRGAGGSESLPELVAAGGNSIRTWDAEGIDTLLDDAHSLGLTVAVGIWLGHERHGFDYDDPKQVADQFARAKRLVEQHKDHPAVLLWGVGNEMEGFDQGDNPRIWTAVNEVAAMIKEIDPHHPTMTVTTFVHGERVDWVHHKLPAIDIHGINAYGGAPAVPQFLADGDATKPYLLSEFGPQGTWEVGKTDWGAAIEPTSTEKAQQYQRHYDAAIGSQTGKALGGYAFVWGNKVEGTPTWFGMWLRDGARLASVDVMQSIWRGEPPANPAPAVTPLSLDGLDKVDPGELIEVTVEASDDDALRAQWSISYDTLDNMTGGDYRPLWPALEDAIIVSELERAEIRVPDIPGPYRIFYTVYDEAGGAATANVPILVKGKPRTPMPFPVYDDGFEAMPWVPSGWMGDTAKLSVDGESTEQVYSGQHSIRMRLEGPFGWAGVAWQHPANNWGTQDGGFDLTGATALEFWARGEYGGEKIGYGVGIIGKDQNFPDSAVVKREGVTLTREWQRYRVPLKRADLSEIRTGFFITLEGRRTPITVYLDQIRYVQ